MKFNEFSQNYLKYSKGNHSKNTTVAYELVLRKFSEHLGENILLKDIKMIQSESFLSACLSSGLKASSVNNYLRHLKAMFNKAIEWEEITKSPFSKLQPLSEPKNPRKFLKREKLLEFFGGIEDFDTLLYMILYYATYFRRNDLLAIKWDDIDIKSKTVKIFSPKKKSIINCPINKTFSQALSLLHYKYGDGEFIFHRPKKGDTLTHLVKDEFRKAGYEDLHLNSLRYSFKHAHETDGSNLNILEIKNPSIEKIPFEKLSLFVLQDSELINDEQNTTNVSSTTNSINKIVFCPNVFDIPTEKPSDELVSAMMPFSSSFDKVHKTIKEAAANNALDCQRADDIWQSSVLIQDIFALIFRSYIVVCDFTGKNPNVFYEAGIAHTLGKHVIPIAQSANDIPFDLRHHKFLTYLNNDEGRLTLKKKLSDRIQYLNDNRE
jgi:integrase